MLKLLRLADEAFSAGEKCILCSVMRLEGSGYGRVGARLLVTESGEREGYISGGCLEKDLIRRVWYEAVQSPRLMAFDTRGNPLSPTRYNTGCQGVVYVLCQPLDSAKSFFYRVATRVTLQRQSVRMLTIYRSQSDSVRAGDALALFSDGSSCGTSEFMSSLGSETMRLLHRATGPLTATFKDERSKQVEVTVEFIEPPTRLVVFGCGDDVVPLVQTAVSLGWDVGVVGRRPEAATIARFPGAKVHVGEYSSVPPAWLADQHTHVLLMTHDIASDVDLLPTLLNTPVRSIGSLGSKNRLARMATELYRRTQPFDLNQLERIRCPVGLDIGAISPEEIATSIVAELIAMDRGKSTTRLADRTGSIHTQIPHYDFALTPVDSTLPSSQY